MSKRTTKAYQSIWKFIKQEFTNFKPLLIVCDYELALQNSLKLEFPKARVYGCIFHWAQVSILESNKYIINFFLIMSTYPKSLKE